MLTELLETIVDLWIDRKTILDYIKLFSFNTENNTVKIT